jgi:hypothetical protein
MIRLILYTGFVLLVGFIFGFIFCAIKIHDIMDDCAKNKELFVDKYQIIDTKEGLKENA